MKLTLKTPKPRNPFVVACRQRRAGAHRTSAQRQQAQLDLRRDIDRLRPDPSP